MIANEQNSSRYLVFGGLGLCVLLAVVICLGVIFRASSSKPVANPPAEDEQVSSDARPQPITVKVPASSSDDKDAEHAAEVSSSSSPASEEPTTSSLSSEALIDFVPVDLRVALVSALDETFSSSGNIYEVVQAELFEEGDGGYAVWVAFGKNTFLCQCLDHASWSVAVFNGKLDGSPAPEAVPSDNSSKTVYVSAASDLYELMPSDAADAFIESFSAWYAKHGSDEAIGYPRIQHSGAASSDGGVSIDVRQTYFVNQGEGEDRITASWNGSSWAFKLN